MVSLHAPGPTVAVIASGCRLVRAVGVAVLASVVVTCVNVSAEVAFQHKASLALTSAARGIARSTFDIRAPRVLGARHLVTRVNIRAHVAFQELASRTGRLQHHKTADKVPVPAADKVVTNGPRLVNERAGASTTAVSVIPSAA